MQNESSGYFLRPEAGPIPYGKHHRRNRKALDFILQILNEAAARVAENKDSNDGDSTDTNRASRICFVSGEPGSGKSTLYLTLKSMLKSGKKYREGYTGKDKVNLDSLNKIQWLDPLDLEVAGDEGENLLAAVLVRIFQKLEGTSSVYSKNCEEAIKELEELATDIGIAWEGNLQERAGALDPDTYSAEVIRTQRARLRVNKRLKNALDNLAKNNCYGCNSGTLFVLPVDDFYLKPDASLQLLRLLRMISIPRLFFLVMGDIKTVEALFIEKSLADWTAVAGTRLFAKQTDRLDEALTRARELRARYLRKLLPPGQRTEIEAMDWYEALAFEVGRSQKSGTTVKSLDAILMEVKLDKPLDKKSIEERSLAGFLISPPLLNFTTEGECKKKEVTLRKHQSAYTALQILDATPREVMDFAFALCEVIRQKEDPTNKEGMNDDTDNIPLLLLCVMNIAKLVREEHSFLNEKMQKNLEGVLPTRYYAPENIYFQMDRLSLKATSRTWKKNTQDLLWYRDQRSWDLTINSKNLNAAESKEVELSQDSSKEAVAEDPYGHLPPRPAAWFVLLHDLAWAWSPDSLAENLVKNLCQSLNKWSLPLKLNQQIGSRFTRNQIKLLQEFELSDKCQGWAVWFDHNKTVRHFPMPDFQTFRDLDQFLHIWSNGIEWLIEQEKDTFTNIISLWILAGWTVLADAYPYFAEDSDLWYRGFMEIIATPNLRIIRFEEMIKSKNPSLNLIIRHGEFKEWLRKAGWPEQTNQATSRLPNSSKRPAKKSNVKRTSRNSHQ